MKRIAADLGVSVTTISKVLNHHADIGHATRARVLKRVEELGYRPNAVARSLSLKRTHTVGIIIPDLMHSFFVEIVSGLESVVSQRGYGLLLCSSGEDARKERSEIEMLRARQVDGIVLASANATGNTALLRDLTALGIALVMIDRDDHPRVQVPSRADRRRRGGPAGHRASGGARAAGRSRTLRVRRSFTRSAARKAIGARWRTPA